MHSRGVPPNVVLCSASVSRGPPVCRAGQGRVGAGDVSRKKTSSSLFFWESAVGAEEGSSCFTCITCSREQPQWWLSLAHNYMGSAPGLKRKSHTMRTMG